MIIPRNSNYTEWKKHFDEVGKSIESIHPDIEPEKLKEIRQAIAEQAIILKKFNNDVSKYTSNKVLRCCFRPNEFIKLAHSIIINCCAYTVVVASFAYGSFGPENLTAKIIVFTLGVLSLLIPVFNEIIKSGIALVTDKYSQGETLLQKAILQTGKFDAILTVLIGITDRTREDSERKSLLEAALTNCKELNNKYKKDNLLGLVVSAGLNTENHEYKGFKLDMISKHLLKKRLKTVEKKSSVSENFFKEKNDSLVNSLENTNNDLENNIVKTEEDKNNSKSNSPVTAYIETPKEEYNNGEGRGSLEIDNNKIDDNKEEEIDPLEYFKHLEEKLKIKELPWVKIGKNIFKRADFISKEKPSEHVIDIPNE